MLKSCKYCGRIHRSDYKCPKKPIPVLKNTKARKFRSGHAWTKMSIRVRLRDRGLCLACLNLYKGYTRRYETDGIEVHHIVPLEEDLEQGLSEDNLCSLCRIHHEMAEKGEIPRDLMRKWVEKSEEGNEEKRHRGGT